MNTQHIIDTALRAYIAALRAYNANALLVQVFADDAAEVEAVLHDYMKHSDLVRFKYELHELDEELQQHMFAYLLKYSYREAHDLLK